MVTKGLSMVNAGRRVSTGEGSLGGMSRARSARITLVRLFILHSASCFLFHCHSHVPRRALDDLHRGFDGVRVEVGHLGFGDLPELGPRDLADLLLVRGAASFLDA